MKKPTRGMLILASCLIYIIGIISALIVGVIGYFISVTFGVIGFFIFMCVDIYLLGIIFK